MTNKMNAMVIYMRNSLSLCCLLLIPFANAGWGGELRYIETGKPDLLNPIDGSRNVIGVRLLQLIFRGLVGQNEQGEWIPEMALKLPEFDEQAEEMIVELREGLLWPDGQPITAEDVVHSFRIYRDERSRYGNVNILEVFADIEAVDDKTVRFKLKRGDRRVLSRIDFFIIPKHQVGEDTYIAPGDSVNIKPMGAGPYQIVDLEDNRIEFGLNPKYYNPPPGIDILQLIVNSDENVHLTLLLSGHVDLDPVVRPQDLPQLEASIDTEVLPYDSQSWYGFAYNCKNEFLKFKDLRIALTVAFNRREALAANFLGRGTLISGPYTISSFCYNPEVRGYPYDPKMTDDILDEMGFIDTDGDQIRDYEGEPFRLEMVLSRNISQANKNVCEDFVNQMKAHQIVVDVDYQEENAWYERVFFERDYDITFVSWKFDEGSNIYPLFSQTEQDSGFYNIVQFEHDEIQENLERFRNSTDDTERTEVGKHLHELLHQECPYTFLWTLEHSSAYRADNVRKIRVHPFYFFTYIDQWELEQ